MSRRARKPRRHDRRPVWQPTFTLALRVLATGQRLRTGEAVCAATFNLGHAARHAAQGGGR